MLVGHSGEMAAVGEVYDTGEFEAVYNLRISDFHTYFVGTESWGFSVWAHNTTCLPEPTEDQWQVIETYVTGLRDLRTARLTGNATGLANSTATLNQIENVALESFVAGNESLMGHIDALTVARTRLESATVAEIAEGYLVGRDFAGSESMRFGRLRDRSYTEIEEMIGRPPDVEVRGDAIRLSWRFEDESMIMIDRPSLANQSPFALNRAPHLARTGWGEFSDLHLSDTGVVVPTASTPAHTPIRIDRLFWQRAVSGGYEV